MLTRLCDGCKKLIMEPTFICLSKRTMVTDLDNNQDSKNELYGDYCEKCLDNGDAIRDLMSGTSRTD